MLPTVYVGAYGYRDNDAIGRIAASSPEEFEKAMQFALETEAADSAMTCDIEHDDDDPEDDCLWCNPDLWYVGPFAESLLSVVRGIRKAERAQFIDDLRGSPSAYVPE